MTARHAAAVTGSALLVFGLVTVGVILALRARPLLETRITGAVVTENDDPRKQMPIANVSITAANAASKTETKSDSSGYFSLVLPPALGSRGPVQLTFQQSNYQPLQLSVVPEGDIVLARMMPLESAPRPAHAAPETVISDPRIRYTVKIASTQNVGAVVRTFEVVNKGGVPCKPPAACSPDGRWTASSHPFTLEAPPQNQLQNVRVSCIAGPCPFTKESHELINDNRVLRISATAWSDTATFLVEADVVHMVVSDMVRQAFPVIFG
ncbi:MAG: carboxypeptidase regulatory-like domain-containing protein, partial [Acidobacteriaceae bacterium]|nr:carboxypeptidase regulatory-like domain-containing protein [Acidobacteriaceae bacterium]